MLEHILEIVLMLAGAALLGFFIGWFIKKNKIDELEAYITALEDKSNRIQIGFNETEKKLIDCQTEKKKVETEKQKIENSLKDCQRKLLLIGNDKPKKEKKEIKPKKKPAVSKKPKSKPDNLSKIEGIGPKIAKILKDAGIDSFKELSKQKPQKISDILIKAGGNSYNRFDPKTWPDQAKLAAEGKWAELEKWQVELKGGRKT